MRIFYDVDTQKDFMNLNGALYVPDAELIKPNLGKLTEYAKRNFIPVLGSVDRHFGTEEYKEREQELARWGGPFPDHCMWGTEGESKIYETILIYADFKMAVPIPMARQEAYFISNSLEERILEKELKYAVNSLENCKKNQIQWGIYFEKQSYDVFTNPNVEEFLKRTGIIEAVVYGVATDYCVKAAALGMRERGIRVYVVSDAIKPVTNEGGEKALEEMCKAGVLLTTTSEMED